jgi:hypothetical protein
MMGEGEIFPISWKCTEGVALSGIKTSSGRTSGETNVWRRRGKAVRL